MNRGSGSGLEADVVGEQLDSGLWRDSLGYLGPRRPGSGARANPVGWFPTGPAIGEILPAIRAPSHTGKVVDVHRERESGPAVVSFLRSVVW